MTVAIDVRDVTKRYQLRRGPRTAGKTKWIGRGKARDFWALEGVSFTVDEGSTTTILGHNGSGKSTVLKCIAGTLRPTSGTITVRGRLAAMLELGAGFHPELTGRENIYLNGSLLGFTRSEVDRRIDEIVDFAQIDNAFIDNPVRNYSSGMYARLGFAVATSLDPDVLLVDEVLAVGDEAFQKKCMDRIKAFQGAGKTILVVTHSPDVARQISDKVVVFDHGRKVAEGNPTMGVRAFRNALRGDDPEMQLGLNAPVVSGKAFVDKVQVEAGDIVNSGDGIAVDLDYACRDDVGPIDIEIDLHRDSGEWILTASARASGADVPVQQRGHVRFSLSSLPLLSGRYLLTVRVVDRSDGSLHDLLEAVESVDVVHPSHHRGLADFCLGATTDAVTASTLKSS